MKDCLGEVLGTSRFNTAALNLEVAASLINDAWAAIDMIDEGLLDEETGFLTIASGGSCKVRRTNWVW